MSSNITEVIRISSSLRLPGDTLLEPLAGSRIALWANTQLSVGEDVEFGSARYKAADMDKGLENGLRLPSHIDMSVHAQALLEEIETFFAVEVGLPELEALLVSAVVMSSWFSDVLPSPLFVHLKTDEREQSVLLSALAALMRNPLRLAQLSIVELTTLPAGLTPTLLLANPSPRTVNDLSRAASQLGSSILRKGKLHLIPQCMTITCGNAIVARATLQIPISGAPKSSLSQSRLRQLENDLRPKLLGCRLRHLSEIERVEATHGVRVYELSGAAQLMPVGMTAGNEYSDRLIRALRERDLDQRVALSQTEPAAVVEALTVTCHDDRELVSLKELAGMSNLILQGRGERGNLSSNDVSAILRNDLMLTTRRQSSGYVLDFTCDAIRRVHECAEHYGCPPDFWKDRDCDWCDAIRKKQDLLRDAFSAKEVDKVHQVHEVHEVHEVHPAHPAVPCSGSSCETKLGIDAI